MVLRVGKPVFHGLFRDKIFASAVLIRGTVWLLGLDGSPVLLAGGRIGLCPKHSRLDVIRLVFVCGGTWVHRCNVLGITQIVDAFSLALVTIEELARMFRIVRRWGRYLP